MVFSGHTFKRTLTILLIACNVALMINRALYTHIHIFSDGSVVTHAHPFSRHSEGHPSSSHHHSNLELFLLSQLNILILTVSAGFLLMQFVPCQYVGVPARNLYYLVVVPISQGRAPPYCM